MAAPVRVLPEACSFGLCRMLGVAITALDFDGRLTDILFVDPAKALFE